MSNLNVYDVHLVKAENGFIIRVGCKVFVFEKLTDLNTELTAYLSGQTTKLSEKYLKQLPELQTANTGQNCATTGGSEY